MRSVHDLLTHASRISRQQKAGDDAHHPLAGYQRVRPGSFIMQMKNRGDHNSAQQSGTWSGLLIGGEQKPKLGLKFGRVPTKRGSVRMQPGFILIVMTCHFCICRARIDMLFLFDLTGLH
jgi:hypothetical protein